jgi:formylglycine-generating enzyme required for sulfatase activity
MARIPAGWFRMGSDDGRDDERPARSVWVDSFELAVFQVTNGDYARFLGATGHRQPLEWENPAFSHPEQPVVAVSWFDAVAYCDWLSRVTGRNYRLPTEAEWERAARGGADGRLYPWGDDPPESLPDYARRWRTGPEPVGRAQPNAYGLHDMCTNVHEWCADWYAADFYAHAPVRNPAGPADGARRASRGGAWRHHIKVSRCAARSSIPPGFQYADYGFRIAR